MGRQVSINITALSCQNAAAFTLHHPNCRDWQHCSSTAGLLYAPGAAAFLGQVLVDGTGLQLFLFSVLLPSLPGHAVTKH
jgi:hypothetical protein